jgi:hypothetical protein
VQLWRLSTLLPFLLPNRLERRDTKQYSTHLLLRVSTDKTRLFGIYRALAIRLQTLFKTGALNHSATLPSP